MWFIGHVNTYSLEATHTLETQDEQKTLLSRMQWVSKWSWRDSDPSIPSKFELEQVFYLF